jgi:proteasome lid subunit RPN8/RPN11
VKKYSHLSGVCLPSQADLSLFRRFGWMHIITCMPFDRHSWVAYSGTGEPMELEVAD